MRVPIVVIFLSFFIFINCDKDNPSGSNDAKLIGSWILVKDKETEIENGVVVYIDSMIYTIDESYLLYVFSSSTLTAYSNDGDETTFQAVPYTASGGKITAEGESVDYIISGNMLILTARYEEDSLIYIYDAFFDKYTGNIPPDGWPPIPTDTIPSNATTIPTNGTSLNGTLVIDGVDWYLFTATSGKTYVIETTGDIVDTYLRLYEVTGNVLTMIASNDDYNDLNARISWSCSSSGTYYFSVKAFDDMEEGDYGISVTSSRFSYKQGIFLPRIKQIKAKRLKKKK